MPTVENCIFCKIVRRDIHADEVARDDDVVAFRDTNPQAPVHILVVPTDHVEHLSEFTGTMLPERVARLFTTASAIGRQFAPGGYRVVMNEGPDAGQTVFHLHAHVLGGRSMCWPPG
jgi:histidine triad (HIT) family protein